MCYVIYPSAKISHWNQLMTSKKSVFDEIKKKKEYLLFKFSEWVMEYVVIFVCI
jgi:hypothetical protein